VANLTTIVICFTVDPTRFAHAVYRVLAIVAGGIEQRRAGWPTNAATAGRRAPRSGGGPRGQQIVYGPVGTAW
jgi:hypothetical protein